MAGLEGEAQSAILHEYARALGEDAAAESLVDRIDKTAGAAVAVDDRKGDRIAARRERDFAWSGQGAQRALVVDVSRQGGEIIAREQPVERRLASARIGEECATVAIGHARCLDVPMETHRACWSVRSLAQRFELAQNHQRDEAWPVWRTLPDVEPAPFDRDWLDVLGALKSVREVPFRLHAARGLERRRHVGCDRAAVERLGAALGDRVQRIGQRRLNEPIALARRAAVGQKERVPGAA